MHHFSYRNGTLHAEDVAISQIAAELGTPFYIYSSATLERHYSVLADAFSGLDRLVCYSAKANSNISVLKTLGVLGAGVDIVSEGELKKALAAGIPPSRIVFSGVGKTSDEMRAALDADIFCFNVESEPEIRALSAVAQAAGKKARIAIRINPDVDAGSHTKISTGRAEDKFGIPWDEAGRVYALAARHAGLEIAGIDMHIGSQISDLAPFEKAFGKLDGLIGELRSAGHTIGHIDLGGGLGIPYSDDQPPPPSPQDYAATIKRLVEHLNCRVLIEPGRVIAGNAGCLIARVLYLKTGDNKNFVIVDAAMNDLMRPTLYDARHEIWPVAEPDGETLMRSCDVVGPICETGDFLARDLALPPLASGDLIAIMSAGAYGAVLANTYNSRRLVPEVLVNQANWSVIRQRQTYDEMLAAEKFASWQS